LSPSSCERGANTAALNEDDHESGTRWVGRSRIGRFGFWVSFRFTPVCGRPTPAFVFSGAGTSCLGLSPLSGFTGATAAAAGTSGRRRMARRVPPFARSRISRGRIRSWVLRQTCLGLAMSSVSNTNLVVRRCAACVRRPFAFARRDVRPPWKRSLTSLQRIEATDALPILARVLF
jgi:hypothetical protein